MAHRCHMETLEPCRAAHPLLGSQNFFIAPERLWSLGFHLQPSPSPRARCLCLTQQGRVAGSGTEFHPLTGSPLATFVLIHVETSLFTCLCGTMW